VLLLRPEALQDYLSARRCRRLRRKNGLIHRQAYCEPQQTSATAVRRRTVAATFRGHRSRTVMATEKDM
jgi:ribosomal protein L25 (general stress protein Ctc)